MHQSTGSTGQTEWYVECGANLPNGKFMRNVMMPKGETTVFRFKHDNRGVYKTAYFYDSKDQTDANLIGDFYLDFDYDLKVEDKESAFDVIRMDVKSACRYMKVFLGLEKEDYNIFFSGSKGIHIIVPWETIGSKASKTLNRQYRMLAEDINIHTSQQTVDLKIYDNRRLFRMENSVHQKTELYKIYISYDELENLTFSQISELAKTPRAVPRIEKKLSQKAQSVMATYEKKTNQTLAKKNDIQKFSGGEGLKYMPPCVSYLLDNRVVSGQRNDTTAFLAGYFKQNGLEKEDTIERLKEWNDKNCEPSMPEQEIEITVSSIYSGDTKMGCSKGKTISQCDLEKCKIARKRRSF